MTITKRQIILLSAVVCLMAVLLWQLQSLRREWSPPATSHPLRQVLHPMPAHHVANHPHAITVAPHVKPSLSLSPEQKQYLHMADAIQMAKMERELIAAKASLVEARVALEKLSHRKPTGSHSLRQSTAIKPYQLHYLGYQDGHWDAVLSLGSRYTTVEGPMTLLNHDQVLQLSEAGLLMGRGDERWLVTMDGVQLMPAVKHQVAAAPPKKKPIPPHHSLLQLPIPMHSTHRT